MQTSANTTWLWCLGGVVLALLIVGVASGTLLRHVVQVVPLVAAAALSRKSPAMAAYASIPLFLFWTAISVLIWAFLLGVSRIANGTYSPIEIGCTVAMVGCSIVGIVRALPMTRPMPVWGGAAVAVAAFAWQILFMWVSFLRVLANR